MANGTESNEEALEEIGRGVAKGAIAVLAFVASIVLLVVVARLVFDRNAPRAVPPIAVECEQPACETADDQPTFFGEMIPS